MIGKHVVVTTDHNKRGVFAGVLESRDGKGAVLTDAQQCVYWSSETKGVFGLASIGPQKGSRVGPVVPRLDLDGVAAVCEMTEEAVEKWKEMPWD